MRLAEQLTFIYQNLENWHKSKLSEADANMYHERLLMNGNIITIIEDDVVVGYMEVWRINAEQLGRLMCGENISVFEENITNGNIAYVSNGYIIGGHRFSSVANKLQNIFKEKFKECKFIARERRKNNQPFKVYPMGMLKGA